MRLARFRAGDDEPRIGVLHEGGFPQRALVVIDPDGVVRWSYQAPSPGELPGVELLREGLAAAVGGSTEG